MVDGSVTTPVPTASANPPGQDSRPRGVRRKVAFGLLGGAALIALLFSLQGAPGGGKVGPPSPSGGGMTKPVESRVAAVLREEIEDVLEWPGTIRSRVEARPAAKLMARITELRVEVGTSVRTGDVIAVLDDRDVLSRVEQAKAALAAAQAQAAGADAEFARMKSLFEKEAATRRDFEAAQARAKSGGAQVEQARQGLAEAEVFLSEAVVRAPFDGVVTEKWAQAGDTAIPGKPLVGVQDPRDLRLEAHVPESCARKAALGLSVRVRLDSLDREFLARIVEIAPVADPESRTFLLKAALPPADGVRPGMFGRFLQPCGKKWALLIPVSAVTRAGQLEMVKVLEDGRGVPRHVRTGKRYGDRIEVLSGLREGENILAEGK